VDAACCAHTHCCACTHTTAACAPAPRFTAAHFSLSLHLFSVLAARQHGWRAAARSSKAAFFSSALALAAYSTLAYRRVLPLLRVSDRYLIHHSLLTAAVAHTRSSRCAAAARAHMPRAIIKQRLRSLALCCLCAASRARCAALPAARVFNSLHQLRTHTSNMVSALWRAWTAFNNVQADGRTTAVKNGGRELDQTYHLHAPAHAHSRTLM